MRRRHVDRHDHMPSADKSGCAVGAMFSLVLHCTWSGPPSRGPREDRKPSPLQTSLLTPRTPSIRQSRTKRRLRKRRYLLDHNTVSVSECQSRNSKCLRRTRRVVHIVVWLVVPRGYTITFHYPTGLFSTFAWHVGLLVAGSRASQNEVVRPSTQTTTFSLLTPYHSVARNGFFPARKPVSIQTRTSSLQVSKVSVHIIDVPTVLSTKGSASNMKM